MSQTVLILGAKGRFGRAATHAFAARGWNVRAASRTGCTPATGTIAPVVCDVTDRSAVIAAARGVDVIVHAVNPPYPAWAKVMPVHTANIIAAGLASGATVMIAGNVYVFDKDGPQLWSEDAAPNPHSRKGALRVTMERAFEDAAADGLRSVILRGGDFIEGADTGNWFESHIAKNAHEGSFTYPGRMDAVHAWAYLPDMARAMAMLAEKRADLPPFKAFGFEGHSLTGTELMHAVAAAVARPLKRKRMPWGALRVMALVSPLMREVLEMRYLWDTPHRLDGGELRAILPDFKPTPLAETLRNAVPRGPQDAAAPTARHA